MEDLANDLCTENNRTVCHNLDGSYECRCEDGFSYNDSEDVCEGLVIFVVATFDFFYQRRKHAC